MHLHSEDGQENNVLKTHDKIMLHKKEKSEIITYHIEIIIQKQHFIGKFDILLTTNEKMKDFHKEYLGSL